MNKKIWLSLAHMSGREQDFIKEAFDTNWMSTVGENINEVERIAAEKVPNTPGADSRWSWSIGKCAAAIPMR